MIDQPRVGIGELAFASAGDLGLAKARVTQCALSRVCGVCARSLSRPVYFLGGAEELDRNAFFFPPTHRECAEHALTTWAPTWPASLGQRVVPDRWVLLAVSGFDLVRPTRDQTDRRLLFTPHPDGYEVALPDAG